MTKTGASHTFTAEVCNKCDGIITGRSHPVAPNTSKIIHTLLLHHGWCRCERYYTYRESFLDLID